MALAGDQRQWKRLPARLPVMLSESEASRSLFVSQAQLRLPGRQMRDAVPPLAGLGTIGYGPVSYESGRIQT
jgi:hypothetical protein